MPEVRETGETGRETLRLLLEQTGLICFDTCVCELCKPPGDAVSVFRARLRSLHLIGSKAQQSSPRTLPAISWFEGWVETVVVRSLGEKEVARRPIILRRHGGPLGVVA